MERSCRVGLKRPRLQGETVKQINQKVASLSRGPKLTKHAKSSAFSGVSGHGIRALIRYFGGASRDGEIPGKSELDCGLR